MVQPQPPEAKAAQIAAASALRRLGNAMADRNLSRDVSQRISTELLQLAKETEQSRWTRDILIESSGGGRTVGAGSVIDFDANSLVGGQRNPFGMSAVHRRVGEECVTTVTFGRAYEGPPSRAHGGAVAFVIDESTAACMAMLAKYAFTASVSYKLLKAAPINVELNFRSQLVKEEGRKAFVSCVGEGPEGRFAEAEAVYVKMDPKKAFSPASADKIPASNNASGISCVLPTATTLWDSAGPKEAQIFAASALRRLGHAIADKNLDQNISQKIESSLLALLDATENEEKRDNIVESSVDGRTPTPDGQVVDFNNNSLVGGSRNPFGIGAVHRRVGNECVTTLTFGRAFEGPPTRAHGGAIAFVIDENTAALVMSIGAFAFTGSVAYKLLKAAPLYTELRFRSWVIKEEGRKVIVKCVGEGPEGQFCDAEAIYIKQNPTTMFKM
jgi:hypothetical protein